MKVEIGSSLGRALVVTTRHAGGKVPMAKKRNTLQTKHVPSPAGRRWHAQNDPDEVDELVVATLFAAAKANPIMFGQ
jgi:hypothetical protein